MIEDIKRRVAGGSLPVFREKEALLAYWAAGRRQSMSSGRSLLARRLG